MSHKSRDVYYRKAKEQGFRARSAFKLLDVDRQFNIFAGVRLAVDLCAAPGSWSQVLSRKLGKNTAAPSGEETKRKCPVIAVDLQEMAPINNVHILQGDITSVETADAITKYFGEKAQLVVCDGAPDVTGLHDVDEYVQAQLLLAALNITAHLLATGGTFVAKVFRGPCHHLLEMQLETFFTEVHTVKPQSSREGSAEHFVCCKGFHLPVGYKPFLFSAIPKQNIGYIRGDKRMDDDDGGDGGDDGDDDDEQQRINIHNIIVPFLACGDLEGFNHVNSSKAKRHHAVDTKAKPTTSKNTPPPRKDNSTTGSVSGSNGRGEDAKRTRTGTSGSLGSVTNFSSSAQAGPAASAGGDREGGRGCYLKCLADFED